MKKSIICMIIGIMLLLIPLGVQAVNMTEIGMSIELPEEFINITKTSELQDDSMKRYYQKNGIYLYGTNEEQNESIMIVQMQNAFTREMGDMSALSEEERKVILEQYGVTKKKENQTMYKQEMNRINNRTFIHTLIEQNVDGSMIQQEEYYTIANKSAYIIMMNSLNKQINSEKLSTMMESMKIEPVEFQNHHQSMIYIGAMIIIAVTIMIGYQVKTKRMRNGVQTMDDKQTQELVTHLEKQMQYTKWKGILVFLVVILVASSINILYAMIQGVFLCMQEGMLSQSEKIDIILMILENGIQLIGVLWIAFYLRKQEEKSIHKIQCAWMGMLLFVTAITLVRFCVFIMEQGMNHIFLYGRNVFLAWVRNIIYFSIWYLYFKHSIRVSVYFKERTLEQIVKEPKKGYQTKWVAKKRMEWKTISYFKQQNAWDVTSGIAMNQLPKQEINQMALSDLMSHKIIRLKRGKYYLSQKDLENCKVERRNLAKNIGWMILIYLLLVLTFSAY